MGEAIAHLHKTFENIEGQILLGESSTKSPIRDFTNKGTIAFLAQHKSCICISDKG